MARPVWNPQTGVRSPKLGQAGSRLAEDGHDYHHGEAPQWRSPAVASQSAPEIRTAGVAIEASLHLKSKNYAAYNY